MLTTFLIERKTFRFYLILLFYTTMEKLSVKNRLSLLIFLLLLLIDSIQVHFPNKTQIFFETYLKQV